MIHRDIKPANIILGKHGETLVLDWGLAKAIGRADPSAGEQTIAPSSSGSSETLPGSALGTPAYMSPEQASGDLDRLGPRSDVYSLGATLYYLLTGKPPQEGDDVGELLRRVQRGDFLRPRQVDPSLDRALEAVCLKAMAINSAERYPSCRALADDVERWMADEPVTAWAEPWTRKLLRWLTQRRTAVTGVAAAVLAGVLGLFAVLAVQAQANAQLSASLTRETKASAALAAANAKLSDAHAKVEARNHELADEQAKVQARFELAQKAIAMFHTGVSEDMLLKNPEFQELRSKLLKAAAGFYADLEKLLAGETDAKSRKALAAAYFQLGELTDKIGSKPEALAVHRKALALRRELAAAVGADVETRLDVARSLDKLGLLLTATGDNAGASATHEEERDLAERLEPEHPTDAVRSVLAQSHHGSATAYRFTGRPEEALVSYRKALAIRQKLADANPAVTDFQRDLSHTHHSIGWMLWRMGKPQEALVSYRRALAIQQKLANANPAVTEFQGDVAATHNDIGVVQYDAGKPEEAMVSYRKVLAIRQKLADAKPAVTDFQRGLAAAHNNIGLVLMDTGKPEEAMVSLRKALAIQEKLVDANPAVTAIAGFLMAVRTNIVGLLSRTGKPEEARTVSLERLAIAQKLADANPTVPYYQSLLGLAYNNHGDLLVRQKRFAEALTAMEASLAIYEKLAEADPKNTAYTNYLGLSHANRGWALVRSGSADGASKAAANLRRAVVLWAKDPAPSSRTRSDRAWALALLAGLGREAKSGVTKAEAAAFADQAVAALRDAMKAGWMETELKEPDFDALRGRDDFKKLVAEVEAKSGAKAKPKD